MDFVLQRDDKGHDCSRIAYSPSVPIELRLPFREAKNHGANPALRHPGASKSNVIVKRCLKFRLSWWSRKQQ
ncbi:hypothetical protein BO82DRAFT_359151 [Aspergillus uvarum CBS 121591]|uniref:Uncharacterized protein n=1 Tax=Aspergillus uvarum CBS 121591 TaxID=1448315 RepID=A0A319BS92_9EURO|nr:hypothetical protein BO82DRAFT_359151 [Aspergillus uvarum CBS 121591]PYH76436.1 hypothetical protein BO82DRAFT_359151 [Aspergillus uvarum CBS 121591]